jgi:gliding motility-associated-like protein
MSHSLFFRHNNWHYVRRFAFIIIALLVACLNLDAQISGGGNKKPRIRGQRPLSTNEEQPITIQLTDLEVEDEDNWFYPLGFSLQVYAGENYTVSESTVYPATNFFGELKVQVTVFDGEDYSEPFNLKISVIPVNDLPIITGQQPLTVLNTSSLTLRVEDLIISDPDDEFPKDFQIIVYPGSNYTVSGDKITPVTGFTGLLSVPVKVSDGQAESNQYNLAVQSTQGATSPIIVNQKPATTDEDQVFTLEFSYLSVTDFDDNYPDGFTIKIYPGENYTVNGNQITPAKEFSGNITANVSVNDGTSESNIYPFSLKVMSANDAPLVELTGPDSIATKRPALGFSVLEDIIVTDVDNPELTLAEVRFSQGYIKGSDFLIFDDTEVIHGVFDPDQGSLALIGKASAEEYTAAMRSIQAQFDGFVNAPITEVKKLSIIVNDGAVNSAAVIRPIFFTEDGALPPVSFSDVEIPTGFTPNGDNVNDTWTITPAANPDLYANAVVRVYSKNGMLVFESHGLQSEWDGFYKGSILPPDVYFYTIDFNLPEAKELLKGIVTLLR